MRSARPGLDAVGALSRSASTLVTVASISLALSGGEPARAGATFWTGAAGNWNVGSNWDGGSPPNGGVDAYIDNGGTALLPAGVNGVSALLNLGPFSNQDDGHLNISGGSLQCRTATIGDSFNTDCGATVSAGSWTITDPGDADSLTLGRLGAATLQLSGGTITNQDGYLGREVHPNDQNLFGVGVANVSGGQWNNSGILRVGVDGDGELNLTGGTVRANYVIVAENLGSESSVTLGGSGTLETSRVFMGSGAPTFLFDGGVFKCTQDGWAIVTGTPSGLAGISIAPGGAKIDTNGRTVFLPTSLGGSGPVIKLGAGTLKPGGFSTYSGGTIIRGGAIDLDGWTVHHAGADLILGDGLSQSGSLVIRNGGHFTANNTRIAAALGNHMTVTIDGGGSDLTCAAHCTVGRFSNGVLTLVNGGSIIASGMTVAADSGLMTAIGTLNVGDGGAPGNLFVPTCDGGNGNATVHFNHTGSASSNTAFSGSIKLNKSANGTTTLNGASTYTGATNVNGGTLLVNGSLGNTAVSVHSGGTLGGSGSIAGNVSVNAGGELAPGASAGTLSLGSLSLNANSTTTIEIAGTAANQHDRVAVAGDANLGGTLALEFIDGFVPAAGDAFTILTAGNRTGTYSAVTTANLPSELDASATYTANSVTVMITAPQDCPEDLDEDGQIGLSDLSALLSSFGLCAGDPGYDSAADFDASGCVELPDLSQLLTSYGLSCP